jgi:inosine-uridine nucleoside N-ribohydrolase
MPKAMIRSMLPLSCRRWLSLVGVLVAVARLHAAEPGSIPVIVDTDIGSDIDDAFALALMIRSPELHVLGITTVASEPVARARIAAKLLWVAGNGWRDVPVYAGLSGSAPGVVDQAPWAKGFTSPALHPSGAVEFLRAQINAAPGQITIVALGELTNLAALFKSDPRIAHKIKAIVLMGGAIKRGYHADSPPVAEFNLKSNIPAAQAVFAAPVPLLVAPLDSTVDLRLEEAARSKIFGQWDPLAQALKQLYALWVPSDEYNHGVPILYDVLPIGLLVDEHLATVLPRNLKVLPSGLTVVMPDAKGAHCRVAISADPAKFSDYLIARLAP